MRRRKRDKERTEHESYPKLVLSIFDRLRPLARVFGVDYPRFRALLEVQLKLDLRRVANPSSQGFQKSPLLVSLLYIGIGCLGGAGLLIDNPIIGMGISLSLVSMMTIMLLVSDHVATLLDATDSLIAGPLPVDDRTFFASRAAHIGVFMTRTAGLLGMSSLVFGSLVYPPWIFIPVYLLSLLLICVLCLVSAFGLILVIIRVLGQERARSFIVLIQICVTVTFIGGMQVLPRIADTDIVKTTIASQEWVLTLLPPFYFGGLLAVATGSITTMSIVLASLAILAPLLLSLITVRLASGGFVANIAALATTSEGTQPAATRKTRWYDRFTKDPVRRAGFDFFLALSRRESQYRLRAYPSLAISFIMGGVVGFGIGGFDATMLCMTVYMLGANLPAMLIPARFSESAEARWVLTSGPLFDAGRFNSGCVQAHLFTMQVPVLLVASLIILLLGGPSVLPDLCFALSASVIVSLIGARICGNAVPFTRKILKQASTEFLFDTLVIICITLAAGGIHALAYVFHMQGALYLAPLLALPVCILLGRSLRDLPPLRTRD